MATAMAAAATAAAAAVGTLTTKAIEGYADYEQLVGGVETLFGSSYGSVEEYAEGVGMSMEMAAQTFNDYQNRQQTVLDNANNAYKTAGLSANEYMETVTGFAAALNSSLGEYAWQSGNYADMAITDMADNANKMGTSMESIQNAYMGFSKQNYTMLDNLKLGYGGTKEEMQRLLSDAEKLEGLEIGSLDVSNFADVVTAIHAVQENLGITGTTAKEASTTIQGSIATAKSAWENWLTGMADSEADFSALTGNLVDAVLTVVDNLIPRIIETIPRVVSGLGELATELAAYIPQLMNELLPPLMDGVRALLTTLVSMLPEMLSILSGLAPQIIDIILQLLPQITEAAIEIVVGLAEGIGQALPELIPSIIDAVLTIAQTLIENIPLLIEVAVQLITGLAQGLIDAIPVIIERLPEIITALINGLVEGLPLIIAASGEIMVALINGLIEAIPLLIEAMPQIIEAIVMGLITGLPQIATSAWQVVVTIVSALGNLVAQIAPVLAQAVVSLIEWGENMKARAGEAITALVLNVTTTLKELPQKIWNTIINCVVKIAEWGVKMQTKAKEAIANVCTSIVNGFADLPNKMVTIGTNIVQGIWNGINNAKDWILDKIKGFGDAVLDGLKSFFGIASPSKVMRDEVGVYLAQGIGVGFEKEMQNVKRTMQNSIPREFDVGSRAVYGAVQSKGTETGGMATGGVVVNQYIYANETNYAKQQREAEKNFRLIARTV